MGGIVTPLGVAHRRELWQKVGGFNEAWCEEDSDLWRRMARVGAEFAYLPLKSGRYHVRADSASRRPHITPRQREMFLENWRKGRPMYEKTDCKLQIENCKLLIGGGTRKIVYVAPHCLSDPTSGAAVATAQGMQFLQSLGFQCRAFCGARLDQREEIETVLRRNQIAYRHALLPVGGAQLPVLVAALPGLGGDCPCRPLEVTIFPNERQRQTDFYRACGAFLDADRPDAVVTYGGDPLAETLIRLAKNRDLPLVFWIETGTQLVSVDGLGAGPQQHENGQYHRLQRPEK